MADLALLEEVFLRAGLGTVHREPGAVTFHGWRPGTNIRRSTVLSRFDVVASDQFEESQEQEDPTRWSSARAAALLEVSTADQPLTFGQVFSAVAWAGYPVDTKGTWVHLGVPGGGVVRVCMWGDAKEYRRVMHREGAPELSLSSVELLALWGDLGFAAKKAASNTKASRWRVVGRSPFLTAHRDGSEVRSHVLPFKRDFQEHASWRTEEVSVWAVLHDEIAALFPGSLYPVALPDHVPTLRAVMEAREERARAEYDFYHDTDLMAQASVASRIATQRLLALYTEIQK